jgi:three-Cys-motif partner protein
MATDDLPQDVDGLPLTDVGAWAKEKHERLRKYIDITRSVRKKFVEGSGGATYIDPFCGTGRSYTRDTGERIDGSPLVALKAARDRGVPFTTLYIADENADFATAAAKRIRALGGVAALAFGMAESTAPEIAAKLNPYGLHFAFLDPFNLNDLPFSVIEALARIKHMDLLIHVSANDLQRNLELYEREGSRTLDRFAPGWRKAVNINRSLERVRAAVVKYWIGLIRALDMTVLDEAIELVKGSKNQRLYWLVFASRHPLAHDFWNKIRNVSGQQELPLSHGAAS